MMAVATMLHKTLLVQVDKNTRHSLGLLICQWVKNQQGGAFKIENENNCQLPGKASKWRGQNIYMYKVPMLIPDICHRHHRRCLCKKKIAQCKFLQI